jgi:hypothetical protein
MPRRSANPLRKVAPTADLPPVAAGLTTPLQHMLSVVNDPAAPPSRRDKMAIAAVRWSRLSEQFFRVDKWSVCRG